MKQQLSFLLAATLTIILIDLKEINAQDNITKYGFLALSSNTTGDWNSAFGAQSLRDNTTGSNNSAIGEGALMTNISGSNNSAHGYSALRYNTSASSNTAHGAYTLMKNTTGSYNTASGSFALYNNTSGFQNTANGFEALRANTTGNYNTASGTYTLYSNTTGSLNSATGLTNVTVLGHRASATASNQVRIGNTSVTSIGGKVGWSTLSDGRFKKNISEEVPGLTFITQLKPVTYTLDITALDEANRKDEQLSAEEIRVKDAAASEKYTGFIAQEVEEAAKKLNYEFSGIDKAKNSRDFYGLRYAEFVVPLVKAVQEQQQQIEELKKKADKVDALEKELAEIKALITNNNMNPISSVSHAAYLEQSIPNPTNGIALIRYYIPQNSSTAHIVLTDMKGGILRSNTINSKGTGQITLNLATYTAGTYTYTLYINGTQADSKKLVVAR